MEAVKNAVTEEGVKILTVAAALESDIAELETDEEKQEFLTDYGLTEPSVNKIIREAYDLLNLHRITSYNVCYTKLLRGIQYCKNY